MGLCKEKHILFIKNLYEFEGFGANRLMKEFTTKGWKKTILKYVYNIWKNNYSSVW